MIEASLGAQAVVTQNILITGGTGLIGSHLSGALAERGHSVKVLSRNSRFSVPEAINERQMEQIEVIAGELDNRKLLEELVTQSDTVFYKAASVGAAGAVENAKEFVENNLGATANLIDVLRSAKHHVKHIVLGSSISVYGEGAYNCSTCGLVRPSLRYHHANSNAQSDIWDPTCPTCKGTITPIDTSESSERLGESTYAVTKKAQEELMIGTCKLLGIDLSVFRYGTVIGAGQSWHNPFTRFLELALQGEAPLLHEDGKQSRDFMFVDDVVSTNLAIMDKQPSGINVFNVSSGESTALIDFATIIAAEMSSVLNKKAALPIIDGKFTPGDVRHCHTDCGKIAALTGLKPQRNLAKGVAHLVDWFVRKKHVVAN